jgi:uncharacterized membrane protein YecN with MAPEG domain
MPHIPVTVFTSAVLGILCVVLSVLVTAARVKTKVLIGDGGGTPEAEALLVAIRTHGNFVEYVPIALILLGATEASGASRIGCEIFAALLIIGRLAHAVGMRRPAPNPFRVIGSMLTWGVVLGLSVEALFLLR